MSETILSNYIDEGLTVTVTIQSMDGTASALTPDVVKEFGLAISSTQLLVK